jgi:hypothetical protein
MGAILTRKGGLGAALAMLALVLQVCVPAGFMVSRDAGAPALVVCTGHGAVTLAGDHGQPGKAPADHEHGVCAFAGHGAAALAAPHVAPIPVAYAFAAPAPLQTMGQAPGRGLAAPPPPSQAPPLRSI